MQEAGGSSYAATDQYAGGEFLQRVTHLSTLRIVMSTKAPASCPTMLEWEAEAGGFEPPEGPGADASAIPDLPDLMIK
jgi:hypothetical protein